MGTDSLFVNQRKGFRKFIAWTTLALFLAQPVLAAAAPVADPNAPGSNRPTVDSAQNGVPVVQIAAPSGAGVSHNKYLQFSIDPNGLILNNSRVVTQTQLAGYITGNPNLAGGSARIILNEVTGGNVSQLRGYLEVAGQKADVIIANPNGIVGSGFGFINTNRGILTTGTPVFGGSGSLEAFRVTGGQIIIEGTGLNASGADRVDLISRAVQVNAGIWGNDLNIVTGANQVDYNTLNAQKIAGDGSQPAVSLDVATLGGMYAGKIRLVGTEQGVGVNNGGVISASGGDLVLTQEGKIINSGTLNAAAGNISLRSNDTVTQQGNVYARGNTTVTAAGGLTNSGTIAAAQNTAITASNISSTGTIASGVNSDGSIGNSGDLTLSATGALTNSGRIVAGGSLAAAAGDLTNTGASIQAGRALTLTASGAIHNDKSSGGVAGEIRGDKLSITADTISNQGGNLTQYGSGATSVMATNTLDNTGGAIATNGDSLTIKAGSFVNTSGQVSHAGTGTLSVTATELKNLNTGKLETNGQLNLVASNIDNSKGVISAQQQIGIHAAKLTNTQGGIAGAKAVNITAGEVNNGQGAIESGKGLTISAESLDNHSGRIVNLDASDVNITAEKNIINTVGLVGGNGKATVTAKDTIQNGQGTIQAAKDLTIDAPTLSNNTGKVLAGGNLTLTNAKSVDNTDGVLSAAHTLNFEKTDGSLDNTRGKTGAGNNLTIKLASVTNDAGTISANRNADLTALSIGGGGKIKAGQDLTVQVDALTNGTGGEMTANGNMNITATGTILNRGSMAAVGTLTVQGNRVTTETAGQMSAGTDLTVTATGNINNQGLLTGKNLALNAQTVSNTGAMMSDKITIQADRISSSGNKAVIAATGDINLYAKTALENKDGSLIHSEKSILIAAGVDGTGNVTGRTGSVLNQSATIEAGIDINIDANQITNKKRKFVTSGVTKVSEVNYPGVYSYETERLRTVYQMLPGNLFLYKDGNYDVYLGAEVITETKVLTDSPEGKILAARDMTLRADSATNDRSWLLAGRTLKAIISSGEVNNVTSGTKRYLTQYFIRYKGPAQEPDFYNNTIEQDLSSSVALFGEGQSVVIQAVKVNNTSPPVTNISAGSAVASISPGLQKATVTQNDGTAHAITLPQSALYTIHRESGSKYLVETDPRFANYKNFMSSDYMLTQLKLDPAKTQKRLGDGFYEQQIVRDQVAELSGRQFLSGYASAQDQYAALLTNGVKVAEEFKLQVGITLTPEQMAKLTTDIVWLVEKEVEGQKVLVPVVYLSHAHSADLKPNGAMISADNVDIQVSGDLTNSGTIKASDNLKLFAGQDIANLSGKLSGGQVTLTAGRDIRNETTTTTSVGTVTTLVTANPVAGIEAKTNLTLNAGRDISIQGGQLTAGKDVEIIAGRDLNVGAVAQRDRVADHSYERDNKANVVSSIQGGNVTLTAAQDANLHGAQVNAVKDLSLSAGGNIDITAVKDRTVADTKVGTGDGGWKRTRTDDETAIGSTLVAGDQVTVSAVQSGAAGQTNRGNITVEGSNVVSSLGTVTMKADNDVTIKATTERHESVVDTHTESGGFLSSKTTDTHDRLVVNQVVGSNVSGDKVNVQSGKDLTVKGSGVVATNDVTLTAKNNVTISSAEETSQSEYYKFEKKSGIFASGVGITIGTESKKNTLDGQTVTQVGSTIGSINANVNITADKDAKITGSDVISGKDTNVKAQNITIDAAANSSTTKETYEYKKSGLTVSVSSPAIDTITKIANKVERAQEVRDRRLATLYEISAARDLKGLDKKIDDTIHGIPVIDRETGKPVLNDDKTIKKTSDITFNVSLGTSSYKSESVSQSSEARGSTVTAGGNVNLTATGSGAKDGTGKATNGDINVISSSIAGQNVTIDAAKDVNLTAVDNTSTNRTTSDGKSAGVGVQLGKEGFGVYVEGSKSNGKENGTAITHTETVVTARDTLTVKSGSDTNIAGGQAKGDTVKMNVGENLNIASQQDIDNYTERTSSVGGKIGITNVPSSVSVSKGKIDSTYSSVTDQSGIYAGKGGFDINVGKNTDLKGAVISSTATPDKNKLDTGTLTYSDIQNKAEYSSSSTGVGYSWSGPLKNDKGEVIKDPKTGKPVDNPKNGFSYNPSIPVSGSDSSTTKSAVSPGTIIVRDNPNQDLSGLSRDTTDALNKLDKIFDKKTVEERQELAKVFGEEAFKTIGDLAENMWRNAETSEEKAKWAEGGEYKILLHALVGGLMSGISGGGFSSGAVGGGFTQAAQGLLANINDPNVRLIASGLIGAVAAKLFGGDAWTGGTVGYYGTRYNDYKHRSHRPGEIVYVPGKGFYKVNLMGEDEYMKDQYPKPGEVYWKQDPDNPSMGWEYIAGSGIDGDPYKEDTYIARWSGDFFEYAYDQYGNKITVNGHSIMKNYSPTDEEVLNNITGSVGGIKIVRGAEKLIGLYGFKVGITAGEIRYLNNTFGGSIELNGSIHSILENASNYNGFWEKTAAITRSIVNNHTFDNGNKRTAFAVVQELMERNGISSGAGPERIKDVIYKISTGQLKDVNEIAKALRGF